ncbi:hypothetical protein MN608_01084 [Microdochium nivale]|nr:hypothetical protein MN608_01084 [Microdochium nivale]
MSTSDSQGSHGAHGVGQVETPQLRRPRTGGGGGRVSTECYLAGPLSAAGAAGASWPWVAAVRSCFAKFGRSSRLGHGGRAELRHNWEGGGRVSQHVRLFSRLRPIMQVIGARVGNI